MYEHVTNLRVRYVEVDSMGYVYHGNYASYYEVGRTELMRNLGSSYKKLEDEGVLMPVIHLECHYIRPARYDDEIRIVTRIQKFTHTQITFSYRIYNQDNQLINEGSTTLVFVNSQTMKPRRSPKWFAEIIEKTLTN
ncbi:MAG TPA: thioesterase family protein [Bacteroidales bacterium]|nr:acyl-CoA thioesterase [Bacteroidales bacterium]OQC60540.1 MAG: Acyl-CoA thioester hydrolase YbgC [Bacteroidetes bacterium ADurb.Bin012]HNQ59537.1 thioesterase family protein [Bacteroidales bacterium]HNU21965.1 thioesterase family protein [Bacteroidales bacterium]HNV16715.1 thioesterase family protein [Bacteroidales bacterium]